MQRTKTVILSVVALIAIGFFGVLLNRYILQSEAAQSKANISFVPADGQKVPEDSMQIIIKPETAGEKISMVDVSVDVKNGQFIGWSDCAAVGNDQIKFDDFKSETQGTTARKACGVLQQASSLPEAVLLSGSVACSGKDPVTVTINTTKSSVVGPVEGTAYGLTGATTVTYACDGKTSDPKDPQQKGDVDAIFEPSSCDITKGETCKYNLKVASVDQKNKISGVYVKLTYDATIMKATDISAANKVKGVFLAQAPTPTPCASVVCPGAPVPGVPTPVTTAVTPGVTAAVPTANPSGPVVTAAPSGSPSPTGTPDSGCSVANTKIDEKAGTMEILYTCKSSASNLPTSIDSTVSLQGIADGSGTLAMTSIQVSGPGRTSPYTVNRNNASYTVGQGGGGGTGDVELDVTLRMQCVVKKPKAKDTLKVRLGVGDGGLKEPVYQTVDFKVDDKGFWKGKAKFNVKPGSGYKVLPKGEYHMQKKVCLANAKEDFPGAYSCDKGGITLKKGTNVIDLSGIVLLTGDIPPGDQDGISNAKDQALVRNLIGKRDAESASLADINFDGVVNAVDHACMIAALSVRYDDH